MNFASVGNKKKIKSLQKKIMISVISIVILSTLCLSIILIGITSRALKISVIEGFVNSNKGVEKTINYMTLYEKEKLEEFKKSIILIGITSRALKISVIEGFVNSNKGVEKTINYMTLYEKEKLEEFKNNKLILDFLNYNLNGEIVNELLMNDNENSFETYIVNKDGIVVASNLPSSIGTDVSDREYFVEVKKSKDIYISNVLVAITTGKTMSAIAQPIIDENGEFLGMVGRDINTSYYKEALKDFVNKSATIFIIDNNGKLLYHDNDKLIGEENNIEAINKILLDNNNESGIIEYELDGKSMISTYGTIGEFGWKIFCAGEKSVLFRAVINMKVMTIGVLLIIIIMATIITIYYTKNTISPIMVLVNKLKLIAQGDFTVRVDSLQTGCEIDLLLDNFNNMMNDLQLLLVTIESGFDEVKEECDKLDSLSEEIREEDLTNCRFVGKLNVKTTSMSNVLEDIITDIDKVILVNSKLLNHNIDNDEIIHNVLEDIITDIDKVILVNSKLLNHNIDNDEIIQQVYFLYENIKSMMVKVLNTNECLSDEFIKLDRYIKNNNLINNKLNDFSNKIQKLISREKDEISNINDLFIRISGLRSSIERLQVSDIEEFKGFMSDLNTSLMSNLDKIKSEEKRIGEIYSEIQRVSNSREIEMNRYIKIINNLKNLSSTTQSLIRIFKVKK